MVLMENNIVFHRPIFEHWKQYNSTAIIAEDNHGNAGAQSQLVISLSQYAETMIPMYEIVQIPLDSYEDLLFVQKRLATYYSMLDSWRDLCGFLTANTTLSGVSNLRRTNYL